MSAGKQKHLRLKLYTFELSNSVRYKGVTSINLYSINAALSWLHGEKSWRWNHKDSRMSLSETAKGRALEVMFIYC